MGYFEFKMWEQFLFSNPKYDVITARAKSSFPIGFENFPHKRFSERTKNENI